MPAARHAVIDIGTNTLLLLVVEAGADGALTPLVDLCRFGRLGKGLDASGKLADDAIAKSLDICREYRRVMDEHGVSAPAIVGTQALREASNAAAFREPAEAILGATIEIIAGKREAELAFGAVAHTFPDLAGSRFVVVDVGGGSTELIATQDGKTVASAVSVPIGAVRLTERYLKSDPPTPEQLAALRTDVDARLATLELPRGVPLIGTAGTATTLAAVHLALGTYDPARVTGLRLAPAEVDAQLVRLAAMPVAQRRAVVGIPTERADVIVAGVAIYAAALARVAAPVMITCDRGIRWGVVHELQSAAR